MESLCFQPGLIVLKLGRYFFCGFCDQKVHLSVSRTVINIDDVILGASNTVLHRSTEISVREGKQP